MSITTVRTPPRFKDFYDNFDAHPVYKDLVVLTDIDAIKNSIKNLVFTNPGERFFSPYLGGGINRLLFENISPHTTNMIQTFIESTIENFEPRAKLIATYVTPDEDNNAYNISIVFSTINNPSPVTFSFILYRVR